MQADALYEWVNRSMRGEVGGVWFVKRGTGHPLGARGTAAEPQARNLTSCHCCLQESGLNPAPDDTAALHCGGGRQLCGGQMALSQPSW